MHPLKSNTPKKGRHKINFAKMLGRQTSPINTKVLITGTKSGDHASQRAPKETQNTNLTSFCTNIKTKLAARASLIQKELLSCQ